MSIFADDMILYNTTKTLLELRNKFMNTSGYNINI